MELGQKLRQARLEAGLSQRQLCGEEITRNMLSQIENGAARPSMTTLQYLAARLEKPVAWFLEEDAAISPNAQLMETARQLYGQGSCAQALQQLSEYQSPDPVFDWEKPLLHALVLLELAEQAAEEGKKPYGLSLLDQAEELLEGSIYRQIEPLRRGICLRFRLQPELAVDLEKGLPQFREELLLCARAARAREQLQQALAILEGAGEQTDPRWILEQAEVLFAIGNYRRAAEYFSRIEGSFPRLALPRLEECWRNLEDYKKAYHYACLQRQMQQ